MDERGVIWLNQERKRKICLDIDQEKMERKKKLKKKIEKKNINVICRFVVQTSFWTHKSFQKEHNAPVQNHCCGVI